MAAFNFPNSPSVNDIHTENGVSWKWNGTIWKRTGSAYTDATNLHVTGLSTFVGNAQFDANVSIGGTLTYEDVKNVDSVGIVTARDKINMTQGYQLGWLSGSTNRARIHGDSGSNFIVETGASNTERFRIASNGLATINASTYDGLTINTTENGTNGPQVQLTHISASPAAADTIGQLRFSSKDSAGNTDLMAKIETVIDDPTSGQETAHLQFGTRGLTSWNPILRLKNRSTASAPSYTTDDINGIILDVYNTGNPYPRYMSFIAKSAGNTDSNILFWTESVGGSPTEKLRIESGGDLRLNNADSIIHTSADTSRLRLFGGSTNSVSNGAALTLHGINHSSGNFADLAAATGGSIRFRVGTSEKIRIDSSGRLLLGTTTNSSPIGWGNNLQVAGTSAVAGISIRRDENGTGGALLVFGKSRGSLNGNTVVQSGDQIGGMYFAGADGTDVNSIAAQISVEVDGTPGGNDMPGRLLFKTTPDGSAAAVERLRITSAGRVLIGTTDEGHGNADDLTVATAGGSLGHTGITIRSGTSSDGNIFFSDATSGDGETKGVIKYAHNGDYLRFDAGGAERLRIASDGIVTIKNNQPPTATLTDTPVQLVLRNATDHNWDGDEHCGAIIFRKGLSPNDNVVAAITATHTRAGSGMSNEDGGIQIWTTNNANPTVPALAWEFDHQGHFRGEDNHRIRLGDSNDLEIWHNGTTSIINDAGTGNLEIQTGGGARLEITSGEVRVKTGDLKIETDNKGIHFSGSSSTPDSNSTSNTRILTDYDEGTCDWELHRSDGLTTGSNNSSTRVTYTKIGNRVLMSGYVYTANTGSSTGVTARLTNASGGAAELPYTPNHSGGMPIIHTRTLDNEEYERMSVGFQANSKTVYVHTDEGNNSYTPDQNDVNINSTQTHLVLAFTGSYETSQ